MQPLGNRKKGQFCVKNGSEINVFSERYVEVKNLSTFDKIWQKAL